MSATPRTFALAAFLAISVVAAPGCIIVADDDSTLTIENQSDFFLDEIRLAEIDSDSWGPNLAPSDGLAPDEIVDIDVDCDFYDLQVVDEDGVVCEVFDLDLCLNDALFIFRNNTCTVFDAARKAREAAGTPSAQDLKARELKQAKEAAASPK
jgi:hypothetical protein